MGRGLLALPAWLRWIAPLAWMGLIYLLSDREGEGDTSFFAPMAILLNLGHAPLFGILALLIVSLLSRSGEWPRLGGGKALGVFFFVLAYGCTDEWHQSWIPHRSASALDLLTDGVGALATLVVIAYLGERHATVRGLTWRLGLGVLACLAAAVGATYLPRVEGAPAWL